MYKVNDINSKRLRMIKTDLIGCTIIYRDDLLLKFIILSIKMEGLQIKALRHL